MVLLALLLAHMASSAPVDRADSVIIQVGEVLLVPGFVRTAHGFRAKSEVQTLRVRGVMLKAFSRDVWISAAEDSLVVRLARTIDAEGHRRGPSFGPLRWVKGALLDQVELTPNRDVLVSLDAEEDQYGMLEVRGLRFTRDGGLESPDTVADLDWYGHRFEARNPDGAAGPLRWRTGFPRFDLRFTPGAQALPIDRLWLDSLGLGGQGWRDSLGPELVTRFREVRLDGALNPVGGTFDSSGFLHLGNGVALRWRGSASLDDNRVDLSGVERLWMVFPPWLAAMGYWSDSTGCPSDVEDSIELFAGPKGWEGREGTHWRAGNGLVVRGVPHLEELRPIRSAQPLMHAVAVGYAGLRDSSGRPLSPPLHGDSARWWLGMPPLPGSSAGRRLFRGDCGWWSLGFGLRENRVPDSARVDGLTIEGFGRVVFAGYSPRGHQACSVPLGAKASLPLDPAILFGRGACFALEEPMRFPAMPGVKPWGSLQWIWRVELVGADRTAWLHGRMRVASEARLRILRDEVPVRMRVRLEAGEDGRVDVAAAEVLELEIRPGARALRVDRGSAGSSGRSVLRLTPDGGNSITADPDTLGIDPREP